MIILGIDPGLAETGCGIVSMPSDQPKIVTYGVISTRKETPLPLRLKTIYDDIRDLCREYKPDVAAIESIFFAANVKTAVAVAQARGVAILATEESHIDFVEYSPLQIKQAIVGYGRASKKQIQEMVRVLLSLEKPPKPDHAADALAVALTHAFRMKLKIGSQNG